MDHSVLIVRKEHTIHHKEKINKYKWERTGIEKGNVNAIHQTLIVSFS